MPTPPSRPIEILLVDDNPGDVRLTREAIKDTQIPHNLRIAKDGEEAMDILRRCCEQGGPILPDLILLDLNMPRKDGREVLAEIKGDEQLKILPVVILTTSDAEHDVLKSYQLHANSYITKPVNLDDFLRVVRSIEEFWFTTTRLPQRV